jgi:hypothetical protein
MTRHAIATMAANLSHIASVRKLLGIWAPPGATWILLSNQKYNLAIHAFGFADTS